MLRHKTHIGWKQRTEKHILSNRKHKRTDIIPDKKNHQDKEYYKRPKGIFHDKRINSSQEGIAILSIYVPNMEKAMAPHSSTLAWKIPWTEEPGRLRSMGSRRVGHDWATSLSLFTFMHWRMKWQPTPVSGTGSMVGCRLWGHTESDTTEVT